MAQSVKDLSYKHKDLCLVPRTQYKMIGMKHMPEASTLERQIQGSFEAHGPASLPCQ